FGTIQPSYTNTYSDTERISVFTFDARCADGAVIARRVKLTVEMSVIDGGKTTPYKATVELEITPTGEIKPVGPKASFVPGHEDLPLGRRFAGRIERTPNDDGSVSLRAIGPHGVAVTGARWYADGALVTPDADRATATLLRPDASIVCVLDVDDGICIAT